MYYNIAICNVCSTALSSNTEGYCKEEKKIGNCENCTPAEDEIVIVEPPKKVQKTLFSVIMKVPGTQSASYSQKIQPAKKNPSTKDLQNTAKTKERTVFSVTLNKWKSELAEKGISEWFTFYTDKDGKAKNLKCKICTIYEHETKKCHFIQNLLLLAVQIPKKSAIEDYAISQPHHHAYELYLKSKGIAIDETISFKHKYSCSY